LVQVVVVPLEKKKRQS